MVKLGRFGEVAAAERSAGHHEQLGGMALGAGDAGTADGAVIAAEVQVPAGGECFGRDSGRASPFGRGATWSCRAGSV
ncbi:hypothetical protein [Actinomadura chokoriensis]|uniref:Uncharacterized protein n=1 Tax=Actinomadura chokoriensis TaxID=454156 RepID=A0ABV4QY79_9ACTN